MAGCKAKTYSRVGFCLAEMYFSYRDQLCFRREAPRTTGRDAVGCRMRGGRLFRLVLALVSVVEKDEAEEDDAEHHREGARVVRERRLNEALVLRVLQRTY